MFYSPETGFSPDLFILLPGSALLSRIFLNSVKFHISLSVVGGSVKLKFK